MIEFQQIVQLRNSGLTHKEIAARVGVSVRSVSRYLKAGKIPKYSRAVKASRPDPLLGFYELAQTKLESDPTVLLSELFDYLVAKGYQGSERTLRRKTVDIRRRLKSKELYFQRAIIPGEIMEGDFTEFNLEIGGVNRKVYLWVTTLPYSNCYFATPYYHCSFECFADGSVNAFNEFNGIAKKYRLDNMSPAVSKILSGKERLVTERYKAFQDHYGFEQDFCNPGKGNEKGNVESNIRHIKKKLLSQIGLHQLTFASIEALKDYVWQFCRLHNEATGVQDLFAQEALQSLPCQTFSAYRTTVAKINKYALFSLDKTGHLYSVPSRYIGLSMEVRIYYDRIEIIDQALVIAQHKRLYGPTGLVSIQLEHIIDGLLKKPGAMSDWKHRHILFERPAWQRFYQQIILQGGKNKDYLSCLRLINQHGRDLVTLAMELAMEGEADLSSTALENLITSQMDNIYQIKPLEASLEHYDHLMGGKVHGCKPESKPGM